ncbi:hypothetical protein N7495_007964 [Penicillium taxi]|uniref:uncharacterized protein n=1 Tax=Penicillium taxi TaxID=168475 RepID=UPI0025459041|nr:uncharacterized protein N7495_007964 [Penicillium taxi]KAJ5887923.1 hypothetical protein N7495_007964 [Penicillium taxi]
MPLHLLGKKSWNVYNQDNIERVKRDEAQAKALEEEEERRMQEIDAERRIQLLRGERPANTPPPPPQVLDRTDRNRTSDAGRDRKKRRIHGEDDTDRDIRLAREDAAHYISMREESTILSHRGDKDYQAPLVDSAGHINLFPAQGAPKKAEKNAEAEADAEKKRKSHEDQYTMRFSNAAGFKQIAGSQPWYSSGSRTAEAPESMPEKNVWGNDDPMRKERVKFRMDASDPLALIKRGVRQLKATEQQRKLRNEQEHQNQLEVSKTQERDRSKHKRRRRSRSIDSLEGFNLDTPDRDDKNNSSRHHSRHHSRRHSRHHRDRSSDLNREQSDRRHSSDHHRYRHRRRDQSGDGTREVSDRCHSSDHRHHREIRDDDRRSRKPELGTAYDKDKR